MLSQDRSREPGNSRILWGKRVLLVTDPVGYAPYLAGHAPKNVDTIVDTGKLAQSMPVHVTVRFAAASTDNGAPILPFTENVVSTAGNGVGLYFAIRRGVDMLAPTTVDRYIMPVGANNFTRDRVPFDVVESRELGVDVELLCPGNPTNPATALWVEAIATPVDYPSPQKVFPGYTGVMVPLPVAASPAAVILMPPRAGRRQFYIVNTSTNANLWVLFGDFAVVGQSTVVLPANQFATYESPVGCFTGLVTGIWDNAAPNGAAMVTEGIVL